ncbi:transposase [Mesorhizobium plurifarium]|uniref:Transposase n=2 Tax=Mesorhizobium TaxID=68287 RepID=A0A090G1J8_MESPL|nr:transposase [Mesorhizobium plurifarium]
MTLEHAEGDLVAEISISAAAEDAATMPGRSGQRRLWSCAEKRALVDLASAAGSSVTRSRERSARLLRSSMRGASRWPATSMSQAVATFARVEVNDLPEVDRPVSDCPDPAGKIVVAFANGARLRIDGTVDPTALRIVLAELSR